MNLVVGNITFEGNIKIPESFDFDIIETISKTGDKNVYLFGETEIKSSKDFVSFCEEEIGKIKNHDISISSEDQIELLHYDYEDGIYELVTFEGEDLNFKEVFDRLKEHEAIFSIREAGFSEKFGNKIIKADFIY